jgi:hypothetical protein
VGIRSELARTLFGLQPRPEARARDQPPAGTGGCDTGLREPASGGGSGGGATRPESPPPIELPVHRPATQSDPMPVHMMSHDPQFIRSVIKFVHAPMQSVWLPGHAHLPPLHVAPPVHGELHEPQLKLSPIGSMHSPLQNFWPVVHRSTHFALEHFCSRGHAVPHAPQWLSSLFRSLHVLPHWVTLGSQWHAPASQCMPMLHALLQPPQLKSLLEVTMHDWPHAVSPCAHFETHLPFEQSSSLWHTAPHAPQFFASEPILTQVPLHSVFPCRHTQLLSTHVCVDSHSIPHPPQL